MFARSSLVLTLFALPFLANPSFADAKKAGWDPIRTTSPEDVKELKLLQESVKSVVDKVTPATVAVLLGPGAGSGVIVSEDGFVLTAAHVIEPVVFRSVGIGSEFGKTVRIVLPGDIVVNGTILGRNPRIDSGIVKITDPVPKNATWPGAKEGKWPFVEIGSSTALTKGQWVVSLGHPGGPKPERRAPVRLGQMVRANAKEKTLVSDCTLVGGDSGGPLFDLDGKVVGIHSRIGMYLEENFHVPTHAFQDEWKQLVRGDVIGKPSDAVLGVILNREGKNLPKVDSVSEDSPSDKAGVKVGDMVLKFDGEPIHNSDDLDGMMSSRKPGETITLEISRGDEILEVKVKLGKRSKSAKK